MRAAGVRAVAYAWDPEGNGFRREDTMAKKARKKRARKNKKANHGRRPNA
jgi:hypothetical protein